MRFEDRPEYVQVELRRLGADDYGNRERAVLRELVLDRWIREWSTIWPEVSLYILQLEQAEYDIYEGRFVAPSAMPDELTIKRVLCETRYVIDALGRAMMVYKRILRATAPVQYC